MDKTKHGFRKLLRHPVTLAVIPVALGAAGWATNQYLLGRDRSDLLFEAQRISQAVVLINKEQQMIDGEPVLCDTAKLTLRLEHNLQGQRPIQVDSIALRVEPLQIGETQAIDCEVDPLETRPFGIGLRNTYVFELNGTLRSGRYIESEKTAQDVDPNNIFHRGGRRYDVSLEPGEKQTAWDVLVGLRNPGIYRVWFTAEYDVMGSKTVDTRTFILAK